MKNTDRNKWTPLKISLVYALFGALWILFSDQVVGGLFHNNPALITRISMYKGWGYVAVTAWLLYIMVKQLDTGLRMSENITKSAEKKLATTLSLLPDAVALADKKTGKYIDVNDGFVNLMGFTRAEAVGKTSLELHIYGSPEVRQDMYALLDKNGTFKDFEVQARKKDASMITILLSGSYVQTDTADCIIFSGVDITQRKKLETEAINRNLELAEANEELKKTNEDLEFFAHSSYHDLREPLRQISLHIEFLESKLKLSEPDMVRSFNFIKDAAVRLDILLNFIRNYTAIRKSKYPPQDVKLAQCVETAINILQPEISAKQAKISVSALPSAKGNVPLYTEVFKNLIENALKYNRNRPEIKIYAQGNDICVEDNGIGIPSEYKDKVFVLFERLHTSAEYSGTGVGLAICKKIAELYGGSISLRERSGGGSVFVFTVNGTK